MFVSTSFLKNKESDKTEWDKIDDTGITIHNAIFAGGNIVPGSEINAISGGIAGGISDGTEIVFRCVFKPTPSTPKAGVKGRHDACVATRAVPVVEAMTAIVLVNLI